MSRPASQRDHVIDVFLQASGWGGARREPLAADASFRRYERVHRDDTTAILMDAPPLQEDIRAYHRVARLLVALGLSAPRAYAADATNGLMLLEDFGDRTYTRALAEGAEEAPLYRLAVDLLIQLHRRFELDRPSGKEVPPYDDRRLLDEALLFTDWYLPAVTGRAVPAVRRESYIEAWRSVFEVARRVADSLVLRDYHVDNLMILEGRDGVASCGLLDFQDAVIGPVSYDLVSLLEDARRDVEIDLAKEMLNRYLAAFPDLDPKAFAASYAILGAQRNAKIIGIFTRLCQRDGKDQYLQHVPRVWRLLEGDFRHPALAPVQRWFDRAIPTGMRRIPEIGPGV